MDESTAAEIQRLTAELEDAHVRLDSLFYSEPRGDIAKDARLTPYLAEARNVLDIVGRLKKLKLPE